MSLVQLGCKEWPQACHKTGSASRDSPNTEIPQWHRHSDTDYGITTNVRISQMSSPLSAQPLKVAFSNGSSKGDQGSRTPVASRGSSPGPSKPLANPADISSPHELTAFVRCICVLTFPSSLHFLLPIVSLSNFFFQVETLLEQLDTKFDDMSSQIIDRSAWCPHPLSHLLSSSSLISNIVKFFTVMQMSQRVDALEASIQDIINGDAPSSVTSSIPPSPGTTPTNTTGSQARRVRSGLQ